MTLAAARDDQFLNEQDLHEAAALPDTLLRNRHLHPQQSPIALSHHITISVPEPEWLPAVYHAASVFAFPSLAEGYGLPVLEAMAAGVPVVMSDIDVLAEIAGSAGRMAPPRDVAGWAAALTAVLSDTALAKQLSEDGRAVAAAAGCEHGAAVLGGLLAAVADGRMTRTGGVDMDRSTTAV